MTVNYTTLLGLAEPITGTQSGTWGDDVNKGITDYLDIAIAGTQTISGTQTAVTLSITHGSSAASNIAQVASGSTGSAQYQIINCTGGPVSLLTITAPASSKTYVVINATSTSQSVKLVAPGPTTGVTVAYGEKAFVVWNGSDFTKVASSTAGAAAGSTTQVQYNSSGSLAGSANFVFDGTRVGIGTASPDSLGLLTTEVNGNSLNISRTASTTGRAGWFSQNTAETIRLFSEVYGASATNTGFGLTLAGYSVIQSTGTASNGLVIGTATNDPLIFGQNDTEGARLTSTGLGVGTTSPTTKIQATIASATAYTTSSDANILTVQNTTASGYAGIRFLSEPSAGNSGIAAINSFAPATGDSILAFSTRQAATLGERFRLGPSGEIGLSGANYGTAGQVLTSQGSGAAPTWAAGGGGGGSSTGANLYLAVNFGGF